MDNNNKDSIGDYLYVGVVGTVCLIVVVTLIFAFNHVHGAVMDFMCDATAWAIIIGLIAVAIIAAFSDGGPGGK